MTQNGPESGAPVTTSDDEFAFLSPDEHEGLEEFNSGEADGGKTSVRIKGDATATAVINDNNNVRAVTSDSTSITARTNPNLTLGHDSASPTNQNKVRPNVQGQLYVFHPDSKKRRQKSN